MKWFLPYLIVINLSYASGNIDSILTKIKNKPDTAKITYLNNICWKKRANDSKLSILCGEKALEISRTIKDKHREARSLNLVGVVYRSKGDYDKSLGFFIKALGAAEEGRDSIEMAFAHNNIGGTYRLKFYNTLALNHILKGLRIFENHDNKSGMAFCCINIGFIYDRQFNFTKSLEYFQKSFDLRKEINDLGGQAISLSWIAYSYANLENYNKAMEKYLEAEKIYSSIDDIAGKASIWQGIASLLIRQKNYTEAIKYATAAIKLGGAEGQVKNKVSLGICYSNLGRFKEGETILQSAIDQSTAMQDDYLKLKCLDANSKLFELKGDMISSLKYARMYISLKDSVTRKDNAATVGEMEAIYNTQRERRENAILHKNIEINANQRIYWIIITILLCITSFVIYGRFLFKKKANRELQQLNAVKDKFFRIIAHDLKNPFSAINGLSSILNEEYNELTDDEKKEIIGEIERSGKQAYRLLENLLYWSLSQTGNIQSNPELLDFNRIIEENFELLSSSAKNKNIALVADKSREVKVFGDEKMITTIVRNLVSNGIKFTPNGGVVSIKMKKVEDCEEIIVEDTGVGIPEPVRDKLFMIDNMKTERGTNGERGTGLGLILCKEFIRKNGGEIKVESQIGKGSKFIFTLPSQN